MFPPPRRSVLSYFLEPESSPVLSSAAAPAAPAPPAPAPAPPTKPYMDIFCDGACVGNGSARARAGFGLYVKLDGKYFTEVSEALDRSELQTNQRAELHALQRALEFAAESPHDVRIFTDSMYSINCITNWAEGWSRHNWCKSGTKEEIQNKDLIIPSYKLWLGVKDKTTIEHVRAHTGGADWKSRGNQRADELATAALRR